MVPQADPATWRKSKRLLNFSAVDRIALDVYSTIAARPLHIEGSHLNMKAISQRSGVFWALSRRRRQHEAPSATKTSVSTIPPAYTRLKVKTRSLSDSRSVSADPLAVQNALTFYVSPHDAVNIPAGTSHANVDVVRGAPSCATLVRDLAEEIE